ncbi:hypothetical protein [Aquipuribacter sp. SD81]|uniref:hypothetical protein n=1 Tax=Aquipuribacter sp. SD81 TaxID=3127703 RepID=UPI0030172499
MPVPPLPPRPSARRRGTAARLAPLVLVAALAAGCTGPTGTTRPADGSGDGATGGTAAATAEAAEAGPAVPVVRAPEATTVLAEEQAALAVATSEALFASAPLVVLAPEDAPEEQLRAAGVAVALGVPLLVAPAPPRPESSAPASSAPASSAPPGAEGSAPTQDEGPSGAGSDPSPVASDGGGGAEASAGVAAEVERLGATAAVVVGDVDTDGLPVETVTAPADPSALEGLLRRPAPSPADVADLVALAPAAASQTSDPSDPPGATGSAPGTAAPTDGRGGLPATAPADGLGADVLVLTTGEAGEVPAVATARAAGAAVLLAPDGDPRSRSATVQAVAAAPPSVVVGLGPAFGDAGTLAWRTETAASGRELPGGGQLVLPGPTYVALYGSPVTSSLGVLGEQGPEATVERAAETAAEYETLTDGTVVPALELIATVASGSAGDDGDYSNEWSLETLRPLVDLAGENGQYVLLDLQPGRSDFLSQAQEYTELLREPHVGLALDPEWRLAPDERHLRQIGSVDVEEVQEVSDWLADLVREDRLPQKMLVLHAFRTDMLEGLPSLDTSRSEVAVVVHVDGQGSQPAKQDTWRTLQRYAPDIEWWGWKNFVDEDSPMLTPEQTVQVEPRPVLVTYQ